ncbi:MAG: LacI family DNA-binding transcriptional regulator [Terrimicrobiaceae bacterium]
MSVTLENIAIQVGCSKATVSRALRNDRLVHSSTRSLVLEAAARNGYERPAKKGRKTALLQPRILLLLPPRVIAASNLTLQHYIRGLTRGAGELDCLLSVEEILTVGTGGLRKKSHLPREIRTGGADVAVVVDHHSAADVETLAKILPIVSIQWDYNGAQSDLVSTFNCQGIEELVGKLRERGHRRLVWIGYQYGGSFVADRKVGFLKGCMAGGLEVHPSHLFEDHHFLEKPGAFQELLGRGITGAVCVNDATAREVVSLALLAGVRIPEDLSVTGFDASPNLLPNGKLLTSYDPIFEEIGRRVVFSALQRLKDPGSPRTVQLCEGRVRVGETIAKCR